MSYLEKQLLLHLTGFERLNDAVGELQSYGSDSEQKWSL